MAEFLSGFTIAPASTAYTAPTPAAPTPPAVPAVALPAAAPALNLGLGTVTILIAGDVEVGAVFGNANVVRR